MPEPFPSPTYVPWPWRRRPHLDQPYDNPPSPGWISINLVRRPKSPRLRTMYRLGAPMLAVVTTNPPPRVYLQAVNRASTF